MTNRTKQPLSPEETRRIWAEYLVCGNYVETGRRTGHPESTVRMAIKRHMKDGASRRDLHAEALAEGEMNARDLMAKVRGKVDTALDGVLDPKELAALAGVVHDSARVASTLRINQARLTGTLIEKRETQLTVSPLTIIAPEESEPE